MTSLADAISGERGKGRSSTSDRFFSLEGEGVKSNEPLVQADRRGYSHSHTTEGTHLACPDVTASSRGNESLAGKLSRIRDVCRVAVVVTATQSNGRCDTLNIEYPFYFEENQA